MSALAAQIQPPKLEVLVIDRSAGTSVPQLWSAGIARARGKIVALTIENCEPAPDWAAQMLRAHGGKHAAVGGAIEIAAGAKLVDWAVYFCRYSAYMLPFKPRWMEDLAADNCSYKKEALEPFADLMRDGFWETFVHAEMRRRGELLLSDPSPVVAYCGGISGWIFLRRRYRHGRYFAARRGREFTRLQRWARAAAFWAVPAVLLGRIGGRVWRNRRHRGKFLAALPLICCFLAAWAAGECAGYSLQRGL